MSNSSLATYVDTSNSNWNYRNGSISRITIHHAAGVLDMAGFSSILRSGRECSWNYGIANDGTIGLFVDESHRAWTSSSSANDNIAVTIEVSNSSTGGDWPVSASAYNSIIRLCEDICRRNGIEKLTYTGSLSGSNLTMHKWFTDTACPGPYLESRFGNIAAEVNRRLGQPATSTGGISVSTSDPNISGSMGSAYANALGLINRNSINYDYLDPYIITINRNTKNVNYSRLKELGVVGVILEAGYLYDVVHQEVTFTNPNLREQIEAAYEAELPIGLYWDAKARSIEEANREMYYLSFSIRIYPPTLGVWAHLQLTKSKSINNSIIDAYYKYLVRLGLLGRVGFYATPSELHQIDWKSKFCDTWYLWMVDHVDNITTIDQLLVPQFFVLPENLNNR